MMSDCPFWDLDLSAKLALDVGCWTLNVRRSFFCRGRVAEPGLRHSTRNRAWGNPPWVRIPPLPRGLSKGASGQRVFLSRQDRHLATSSSCDYPNAVYGMKSQLHPACSTAASSLHLSSMNILSRFFVLLCLTSSSLISITSVCGQ